MDNDILEVQEDNFSSEVMNSNGVVMVDFYADWCGPCKMLYPILQELKGEFTEKLKIVKCNIENNVKAVQEFNIRNVPSILIFKNGKLEKQNVGLRSKKDIKQDLEEILNEK